MLGTEPLSMAPASTRKIALNWKQYVLFIMLPLVLSGCTPKSLTASLEPEPEVPVVKQQTIDYRWAECKTLSAFMMKALIMHFIGYAQLNVQIVL